MIKNNLIKSLFFSILVFFSSFSYTFASMADGIDVNLNVGSCNNNGVCEQGAEDFFSCPADCTPVVVPDKKTGGYSPVMENVFNDLTVEVSYTSAVIKWNSSIPTMSNLRWGTNPDYKDGVIKNINFLLDHKVELRGLKEGTVYYFSIEAENLLGKTTSIENQVFMTLSLLDTTPPSNPTNVKGFSDTSGITISWTNPTEEDFDYIRVMRNDFRYYGSPYIGKVVYEGNGNYFIDSKVVEGHKYFYSLFSRDRAGNYSSGALINIIHNPFGLDNWGKELTPDEELFLLPNIIFIVNQNSSTYDFYPGGVFSLSGDVPINIKTNYSSVVKNDDMWVEIRDSKGIIIGQYFFSRIKDNDGFINVTIPFFEKSDHYKITVHRYKDGVSQLVNHGGFTISKVFSGEKIVVSFWYVFWFIVLIIVILFLIYLLLFLILPRLFKKLKNRV